MVAGESVFPLQSLDTLNGEAFSSLNKEKVTPVATAAATVKPDEAAAKVKPFDSALQSTGITMTSAVLMR